jgi:DNA-binding NtrC family response regulator
VEFFRRKFAEENDKPVSRVTSEALRLLLDYSWPGNVRELENVVRKVLLLAQSYTITAEHVRTALSKTGPPAPASRQTMGEYVDELLAAAQRGELNDAHARLLQASEQEIFTRAIKLAQGNQARAARWLGVSRLTMREKLIQFGIHPAQEQVKSA